MFERFSDNARQAVVLAQEEARTLEHPYIGSEHLLLGVARNEEGTGAAVLVGFGIVAERLRDEIVSTVGRGEERPHGAIPFTRAAREVLEDALHVARSFHDGIIASQQGGRAGPTRGSDRRVTAPTRTTDAPLDELRLRRDNAPWQIGGVPPTRIANGSFSSSAATSARAC